MCDTPGETLKAKAVLTIHSPRGSLERGAFSDDEVEVVRHESRAFGRLDRRSGRLDPRTRRGRIHPRPPRARVVFYSSILSGSL